MHNSESERIRDMVLLWHMVFGKKWISGSREDLKEMPWERIWPMVDTLTEHQYLEFIARHGAKTHARLNNKALKLIGAVEHDGETT